ncbi:MAG: type II secretion system protein GspI [Alteromonadaceae bacterium]|nr:type II secretion system protein GspI [Alteromonadaceae bacterium]
MVALLIFGLTGVAVLKATSDNLTGVSQIKDVTVATYVANNRLNQIHIERRWPLEKNAKGEMTMLDRTWYWRQDVSKTEVDDMVQVRVWVSLDSDMKTTITDVVTFFTPPVERS